MLFFYPSGIIVRMSPKRYLSDNIASDLRKKMVFLAGPRQVGKTTLAKKILKESGHGAYYLWDNRQDRQALMKAQWPPDTSTIVLDELHKYKHWKQWIKGEYDKHKDILRFLVTGSARMDVYRKGGDSLQGRYHHYRLHPFSLSELAGKHKPPSVMSKLEFRPQHDERILKDLLKFSGFPEPIMARTELDHRRWQKERLERFFREDIRDFENVRDLSLIQILADLLPQKVGSPLSLNSLREDVQVSHKAITHWMAILERLYHFFLLRPYTTRAFRGLKKEPKLYLWDWTLVDNDAARFENLMASHLLKFCHYMEDAKGYRAELSYLRDVDKREVDFLVTVDRKPWFAVEAKLSDENPSPALSYFGTRLKIPQLLQVVLHGKRDFIQKDIRVLPALKFLSALI